MRPNLAIAVWTGDEVVADKIREVALVRIEDGIIFGCASLIGIIYMFAYRVGRFGGDVLTSDEAFAKQRQLP